MEVGGKRVEGTIALASVVIVEGPGKLLAVCAKEKEKLETKYFFY